mgnify:CR=1 FL=1
MPGYAAPLEAIDAWSTKAVDEARWPGEVEIVASKKIVATDPYLGGHYPNFTIYPGVFIIETVVQVAREYLVRQNPPVAVALDTINSVRFLAPLLPGDELNATCRVYEAEGFYVVKAKCFRSGGDVAATMTLRLRPEGTLVDGRAQVSGIHHAKIKETLPHRHPVLQLDRVVELVPGHRVIALKAVTGSDPCYAGIPDGAPEEAYAFPVSLVLESLGQAGGFLWMRTAADAGQELTGTLIFGAARGLRVYSRAHPGDVIRHEVELQQVKNNTAFMVGRSYVGDRLIAEADDIIAALRPEEQLAASRNIGADTDIQIQLTGMRGGQSTDHIQNRAQFNNTKEKYVY